MRWVLPCRYRQSCVPGGIAGAATVPCNLRPGFPEMIAARAGRPVNAPRLIFALSLPVAILFAGRTTELALAHPTLLFYPASIVAALVGGIWGGLGATLVAVALLAGDAPSLPEALAGGPAIHWVSLVFFATNGVIFSLVWEKLQQVNREAATLAGDSHFRRLVELAGDGIVAIDAAGRVAEANPAFLHLVGFSRDDLLGQPASDLVVPAERARLDTLFALRLPPGPEPGAWNLCRQDGRTVLTAATLRRAPDGHWAAVFRAGDERDLAEALSRTAANLNQAVLDSVMSQVAVVDRSGIIIAINEAWADFARTRCDTDWQLARTGVGVNFLDVCRPDDEDESRVRAGVLDILNGRIGQFHCDCPCEFRGQAAWYAMNVTPLVTADGGAVISYLDITDIKRAQETEHRANVQLKTLAIQQLVFQEEERRTLSRELHDHVSQDLAALQMALENCSRQAAGLPKAQVALRDANAIANSILETTRDISRRLRPPLLDDMGLAAALRWHIDKLPRADVVGIRLKENIGAARFPAEVELASFRTAQEALSNALRHAQAGEIIVQVQYGDEGLHLSIKDDGRGFDADQAAEDSRKLNSLGLLGMRERVAGAGGELQIRSQPGEGTEICADFPLLRRLP